MKRQGLRRGLVALTAAAVIGNGAAASAGFSGWSVVPSPNAGAYGSLIKSMAARSATDAWAVGGKATSSSNNTLVLHWNGSRWAVIRSPNPMPGCEDGNFQWTGNTLNAATAVSATDAWAVGTSCYSLRTLVERWDGTSWRIVPSPSFSGGGEDDVNELFGVAAVSSTNVWAVGEYVGATGAYDTLVEHWDGTRWSAVPSPNPSDTSNTLAGVAVVSAGDIWAVGYTGASGARPLIEHWNGSTWSVVASPTLAPGSTLSAVTAISASDVWAVGTQVGPNGGPVTLAEHWNGTKWSVVPTPNPSNEYGSTSELRSVVALGPGDVWAVGMHEDESTIHQHRTLTLHWNGTAWSIVASPSPGKSGELNAVTAAAGRLFAGGLYSNYDINIYDGTYTDPRTLVLGG